MPRDADLASRRSTRLHEDDCALADPVRHALVIDCVAVLGGCCVMLSDGDDDTADFARAS